MFERICAQSEIVSAVGITAGAKKGMNACSYRDYYLVTSPASVVTVKPTAGFWWSHLLALPPVHSRAEVLGHPWRWLALTRMGHLSDMRPQSVKVSKGLKHHPSFEKEVQLYPAWCLHEAHRTQTRCYKYIDGGIHTRTKVSWNLLNLNQTTFSFLEK